MSDIIIIKDIYIAQVREGHKCAMSAEMAVWLRNCLYVSIAIVSRTRPSTGRSATQGRKVAERSLEGRVRGTPGQQGATNTALHRSLGDPGPIGGLILRLAARLRSQ